MIGVVITGLEFDYLLKLKFRLVDFSSASEVCSEIGSGFGGIGLEANGFFEVHGSFGVLRLGRVDQAEELMNFKTLRNLEHQFLQCSGSFGEMARVVISDSGLKLAI